MRQKFLTIGLLAFISLSLTAQEFISEDKQWNVLLSFFMSPTTEIYLIQGDSVHNSTNYKIVWMTYDSTLTGLMYQGLVREDNDVVYYIPPDGTEGVLYDFTLQVGDTAYVKNMFNGDQEQQLIVHDIDTVEYFGVDRKRWLIDDEWLEYWIEGIGSTNGLLHTMYYYWIVCPVWELLCYHENDNLLYILPGQEECYQTSVGINEKEKPKNFKVVPNPVVQGQTIEIQAYSTIKSICVLNRVGELVKQVTPSSRQRVVLGTDELNPGLYLIRVETSSNQTIMGKLLVR